MKPLGSDIFSTRNCSLSIVCAETFHFRVRDGNGWYRLAQATKRLRIAILKGTVLKVLY